MIVFLKGRIIEKSPAKLVIETGGMGFELSISLNCFQQIGNIGDTVEILTDLVVREDAMQLYGFISREERDIFKMLVSVSGVGPKLAQGILSGLTAGEFVQAIAARDVSRLVKAPGVGKKTAERLVLELKDKIIRVQQYHDIKEQPVSGLYEEVVLALISLGYKETQAREAVSKVRNVQKEDASIEELIRLTLPFLR